MEKAKRQAVSKKIRFEVFKRDGFICQYCGASPPRVVLNIDHINPVSSGGSNDIDNLVTACFSCNSGKSDNDLRIAPDTLTKKAEKIKEMEMQLTEYKKLLSRKNRRINKEIKEIEKVFAENYEVISFTDVGKRSIKANFLTRLDSFELVEIAGIACQKGFEEADRAFRYFCGICWNRIRSQE